MGSGIVHVCVFIFLVLLFLPARVCSTCTCGGGFRRRSVSCCFLVLRCCVNMDCHVLCVTRRVACRSVLFGFLLVFSLLFLVVYLVLLWVSVSLL